VWLPILLTIIIGYLLGNLNGAVCISHLVAHEDVRTQGSGNAGLTNFIRVYGAGKALSVIVIDGGKAAAACLVGGLLLKPYGLYREGMAIGGAAVMLGHIFPVLLGFKGGKGILSGLFIALMVDWRIALIILGVFAVAYFATQYVSLGSVLGSIAFGVGFAIFYHDNLIVMLCGVFMAALATFMHRENIKRLLRKQERKTNLFGKGSKQ
jgi:glycerol-3-phosphate acyltransferase PlsY